MRGAVPALRSLAAEFAGRARLVFVYVAEAHAQDEWPISSGRFNLGRGPVLVDQPVRQPERLRLARRFTEDFGLGGFFDAVLADDLESGDAFLEAFAPWPFRFFGLLTPGSSAAAVVAGHVSHPQRATYDLAELRAWLLRACQPASVAP